MIDGVNDTPFHAKLLARHAKRVGAHVNLIPLNKVEERRFSPSTPESIKNFELQLKEAGVNVTVRRRLGGDIEASCGQLRKKAAEGR
jgi:23S rRNA (adenine2503-C2)-methyltransferase